MRCDPTDMAWHLLRLFLALHDATPENNYIVCRFSFGLRMSAADWSCVCTLPILCSRNLLGNLHRVYLLCLQLSYIRLSLSLSVCVCVCVAVPSVRDQ